MQTSKDRHLSVRPVDVLLVLPPSDPWSTGFGEEDSLSPWGVCIRLELRGFFNVHFPSRKLKNGRLVRGITRRFLQRPRGLTASNGL